MYVMVSFVLAYFFSGFPQKGGSMRIKIFQMKNSCYSMFDSYERYTENEGHRYVDRDQYNEVFAGDVEAESLEDVYRIFNIEKPENFRGRSLSVSDVVEKDGNFYYCDSFGFKDVDFHANYRIPVPEEIAPYLENTDKVPTVMVDGTSWFLLSRREKACMEEYLKKVDSVLETVWRKYPEEDVLYNAGNGSNAERILRNCKIGE